MPVGYVNCPYCNKEIKIDYEGREQGQKFKQVCLECYNEFEVYFEISINFWANKIENDLTCKKKI